MEDQEWVRWIQKRTEIRKEGSLSIQPEDSGKKTESLGLNDNGPLDERLRAMLAAAEGQEPIPFAKIRLPEAQQRTPNATQDTSIGESGHDMNGLRNRSQRNDKASGSKPRGPSGHSPTASSSSAWTASNSSSAAAQFEERAEQERMATDAVAKDMRSMVAQLREQSLSMREVLGSDLARLDTMEDDVNQAGQSLTKENRALEATLRRTFSNSCTMWITVGVACIAFLWMILLMRII